MKLNLKKVAFGATITGMSVLVIRKMFHVKRLKVNQISQEEMRFSHRYPEPNQPNGQYMRIVTEEHLEPEENNLGHEGKSRSLTSNRLFENDKEV
jgi:hypothetical protein